MSARSSRPFIFAIDNLEPRICLASASDFVAVINNPYFPLFPGTTYIYRGADTEGHAVRDRFTVTDDKKLIDGITTTVIRDRVYQDGDLIEDTHDYFAQDRDGNVWYFGEDSTDIENGIVVSTEGSCGEIVNGAKPGIVMKGSPSIGDTYAQEEAIGVAEDQASIVGAHSNIPTPFSTFGDCLRTDEFSPLEPGVTETKFYARGIGLVKSQPKLGDSETLRLAYTQLAPEAFSDKIDNPYFPLTPGTTFVYRGTDAEGGVIRSRFSVTSGTRNVAGVTTRIIHDRVYSGTDLIENTHDYFAQDKLGNVWYFGEDSRDVENGHVTSTEGSWLAGVNGATAGIVMKAFPSTGDTYQQEHATGVAEDAATVLSTRANTTVPFGAFQNVLKTRDFSALAPEDEEHKYYAPGIGLIKAQDVAAGGEVVRLIDIVTE